MNFKEEYKKETDMLCENGSLPSGEEMLRIVQEKAPAERDFEMKTNKKMSLISKITVAVAACALLSGTTVYAFEHTSLGDLFRSKHKDEITADIIDEGYFFEINETQSDSDFNVTLLGITGDWSNPKFVFDIEILNDELAAKTETIRLGAKILNEDEFAYNYDNYAEWEAEGVADDVNTNLYHFDMPGPSAFIINGEKVITDIAYVIINDEENYAPDMQYNFRVPMDAYKESYYDSYTGAEFTADGKNYTLEYAEFGSYDSQFNFILENGKSYSYDELESIGEYAKNTFVLTVDGVEYTPVETGESLGDETAGIWVSFPSIDRVNAQTMTLTADGNITDLMSCIATTSVNNHDIGMIYEAFKGAEFTVDDFVFTVDNSEYYEDYTALSIYIEDSADMGVYDVYKIRTDMQDRIKFVADNMEYSAYDSATADYFDENMNKIKSGIALIYPSIDRKSVENISIKVDENEISLMEYAYPLRTF